MNPTTTSTSRPRPAPPSRRRPRSLSTSQILLLLAALAAALLPPGWSGCARAVTQPLTGLRGAAAAVARSARRAVEAGSPSAPLQEELQQLRRAAEDLERQVRHQSLEIAELRNEVARLSGLRGRVGETARLVPASVVAHDATPRRQSLVLDRGSANTSQEGRIQVGQWVAAADDGLAADAPVAGRERLARQWLVGRVAEVHAFTSVVQLASDPRFGPLRVRAAHPSADGGLAAADRECLLEGRGDAGMIIRQAPADYLASGHTWIVVPADALLPATMLIARVTSARPVEHAPLLFDLTAVAPGPAGGPRRVYVIVPSP